MARIFLSHSSRDNAAAVAIRDWLTAEGWDDLFLDLDPSRGIAAGERWERRLHEAANRCEAVIFLVSRAWLESDWCLREFRLAQKLNKRSFGILIEPMPVRDLPAELTVSWQFVDLAQGADHRIFRAVLPDGSESHVTFSTSGLARLKAGLMRAGLDARFFQWPPEDDPDRPPYRGMRPLEAEDAGIFFGREAPTIEALDRLRGLSEAAPPRFLVILGASGAGKSSFLRAGLLPRLARDDRHYLPLAIVRPERAALGGETGLIRSLEAAVKSAGLRQTRAEIKAAVESGAPAVAALLAALAEKARVPGGNARAETIRDVSAASLPGTGRGDHREAMVGGVHLRKDAESKPPRIVLAIDQAEELFLAEGAAEADAFLRLVRDLAADPASNLIVIATIRSDGYERLQTAAALEGIRQETFSLPPLPKGAYQTVIEGPAARLADTDRPLKVEPALTAALLRDVEEGGAKDALPLLAFTLERLYLEHGGDGDLRLSEYRQLGGIKGSIDAAVEGALRAADTDPAVPRDRAARESLLRRALIPWLAGIDPETGAPRRRVARLGEIPEEARPLVAHLITARLLATDRNPDTGETTVEPAHEALLRQWGLLQGWLEEDFAALSTLEGAKRAARDWEANARLPDWLSHAAGRLDDAEALLARDDFAASLDPSDRAYLAAARAADTARRDRELEEARKLAAAERNAAESARDAADKQRTVANRTRLGLLAASLLAILAAGAAWYGFNQAQKADEQASIASEQARIAEDERVRAEEQAAAAHSALARMLIERTWSTVTRRRDLASRYALTGTSSAGNETVARAALARVMERGAIVARIKVHARQILLASYDPSGDRLVTVDETGETAVTDLTARSVAWRIRPDSQTVSANFSPDGAFVVTVQQDGEISYHHAASGESLMALEAPSEVATAKFSPDGRRLVTSGRDGSALLWDTFSGALLVSLNGHRAPLTDATFSPDGRVILTASIDGTAVLWGADDGELIARLRGHEVAIRTAAFSPDGSTILTASQDDTAIIWDRASGREIRRIESQWALDSVSFNDDGSSILANDIAGNFMEWSVDGLDLLRAFDGQLAGVEKGMFMQNGHVFAGSGGVTSIIWESASARTIGELSHGGFGGRVLAFNGGRNSVVIGLQNGSLLVWDFSQALESISELAASACDGLKANERKFSEFDVAADPLIREVWTQTDASRPVCPNPVPPSAQ